MSKSKETESSSPEHCAWMNLRDRCYNHKNRYYYTYGGRGITVCEAWRNSYAAFLADVGRRPSKEYSLDRIDPDKPYEKSNVRWATVFEQASNKSTSTRVMYNGKVHLLAFLCRDLGVDRKKIQSKLMHGADFLEALNRERRRNNPLRMIRHYEERAVRKPPPVTGPALPEDLTLVGTRFGLLVVQSIIGRTEKGGPIAHVKCDCGNESWTRVVSLRHQTVHQKSCGCTLRAHHRKLTQGRGGRIGDIPEYRIWVAMRGRVENPKSASYYNYGARGITMDPNWSDFRVFFADVGPRPSKRHQLDRIDVNGNYTKSNVRWLDVKDQMNNKRNNTIVEFRGEQRRLTPLCEQYGLKIMRVRMRLYKGWPVEEALFGRGGHAPDKKTDVEPLSKT